MRCVIHTKDVVLRLSRGTEFQVSYEKVDPELFRVEVTDETISITQTGSTHLKSFSVSKNEATVNVTLPDETMEYLSVSVTAGLAKITDVQAGMLELRVSAGMARLSDVRAHETTIEVSAGAVQLCQVEAGRARIEVNAGSVRAKASSFSGGAKITNTMGQISLKGVLTEGSGYSARSTLGTMRIAGQSLSGMGAIRAEGDPQFEISNITGSIRLS